MYKNTPLVFSAILLIALLFTGTTLIAAAQEEAALEVKTGAEAGANAEVNTGVQSDKSSGETVQDTKNLAEQKADEWSPYYPQHSDFVILMPEKVTWSPLSDLPEEAAYRGTTSTAECILSRMRAPDNGEAGFKDFCNGFIDGQVDTMAKSKSIAKEKITASRTPRKGKGWYGELISININGQPLTTNVIALTKAGPFVYCVSISQPPDSPFTQKILESFRINESKVRAYVKLIDSLRF